MVKLANFKYLLPIGMFSVGSYLSYSKSLSSAAKFHNAAIQQSDYIIQLQEISAGNESHWSSKIPQLNINPALLDSKIGVDGITSGIVAITHVGLGMLSAPIALLPFIPYAIATSAIAYSESTRKAQYSQLIKELWIPQCTAQQFKESLITASKIGSSYNSTTYAKFITKMYQIEDTTNYVQFATIGAGLWNAYKAITSVVDDAPPPAPPPSTPPRIKLIAHAAAISGPLVDVPLISPAAIGSPVATDPHRVESPVHAAPFVLNPHLRDAIVGLSSIAVFAAVENAYSIGSVINSTVYSVMKLLTTSERNTAVEEYIIARETARKMIEIDILQQQFEICSAKNPEINAQLVDTYTTDNCNDNGFDAAQVLENLLMGKEGCKFIDPAV